ncbi:hypothetical protein HZB00_01960 [Candidatus Woesearchaeota archaeon]|nr:hypothetical protein [Candidatus Woesearchaeota archaeon]
MSWKDLKIHIGNFEQEVQEWQKRFEEDKENRWLVNYIFISEKIKANAQTHLDPLYEELEKIKIKYGEMYKQKDLSYHVESAKHYTEYMKNLLKEVYHLYKTQADYTQIKIRWEHTLPSLRRRSLELKRRIEIIDKILSGEKLEEEILPYHSESAGEEQKKSFWQGLKEKFSKKPIDPKVEKQGT